MVLAFHGRAKRDRFVREAMRTREAEVMPRVIVDVVHAEAVSRADAAVWMADILGDTPNGGLKALRELAVIG